MKKETRYLIDALRGSDEQSRFEAAYELRRIRDPMSIAALTDTLQDSSIRVRLAAVMALAAIDSPETRALLSHHLLTHDCAEVRARCGVVMGMIGSEEFVPVLVRALSDKSPKVRASAARSLGEIGVSDGEDKLRSLLNDKNSSVRFAACFALVQMGHVDQHLLEVAQQLAIAEPVSRRAEVDRVQSYGIETLDERDLLEIVRQKMRGQSDNQ